jgi:small ligand-binding sensory domain FIST
MTAKTFSASLENFGRTVQETVQRVPNPSGGIVFVSGTLTSNVPKLARSLRQIWKGFPTLVVPAQGVLSERGELEGAPGASGVVWSGGRALPFAAAESGDPADVSASLVTAITHASGDRASSILLFPKPDAFQPSFLDEIERVAPRARVFGGGTPGPAAVAITATGDVLEGGIVGFSILGLAPPLVDASPACRLLTELMPIDEVNGAAVLTIAGEPALDRLSASTKGLGEAGEQPLVLVALEEEMEGDNGAPRFVVRQVRGIDPSRRAVMLAPGVYPGQRMAFAVRDAAAARTDLEAMTRRVHRQTLGAAPRFALFLSCAGRGQGLYGSPDVESRLLRQRFSELPIAGMHSSFEIAPLGASPPRMHLYTAVLALFRSPS